MPRFSGYDALAVITVPLNGDVGAGALRWPREYHVHPIGKEPGWTAQFLVGRGLPPGTTAEVRLLLQPPGNAAAQLYPGLQFEIHEDGHALARGWIARCWFGCADSLGVRTLTRSAFLAEALPLLLRVCRVPNEPFEGNVEGNLPEPFQPGIPGRGALAWPFSFTTEHCRAFVRAARAIGDSGLYVWVHEAGLSDDAFESWPCCYFPLQTAEEEEAFIAYYDANPAVLGVTLFSATGRWAAIAYGGADFAVVGGPAAFMELVYAVLGTSAEEQALEFLAGYEGRWWLRDPDRGAWVPELLVHLHGHQQANRYIAEGVRRAQEAPPLT